MNVELRHLRALAAIGDEGNLTRAAQVLHISQPALSRTLDQLETRLGTRLVERTTRRLALTQAGRRLWEHAHRMLRELDDALAEVTAGQRPLRVGFPWAALGRHTVPLLRSWRAEQPATTLAVRWCDDPEAALRQGEVDAAFLRLPPSPGTGLDVLPLYREPRLAAVPAGDPLAERESLRLADLVPRPVAICATASTTRAELWPEGERPDTFEVAGVDEWLTSIATGESVGVTAAGTADSHPHPDVRYLPLTDTGPVTVHLAWPHTPTHPATRALREHAVRRLTGRARTQAMSV
ncbi:MULTISPECIES: LysR family transcriptional regulator [Streptomyces]|uniref:LysR family transcriptional regulator n=1 Tax=Streptomyces albus TaxID=1888 RepID=A0A8H1LK72_9ACTN|nr:MULTISPECIES: LysR family transcriptional regulator [Streptomyces]TGG87069.1 LysR family transcriptional regulator [Streptomyces albus]UVN58505.1 LysR family transcriptional regulator [Streptomyces albus]